MEMSEIKNKGRCSLGAPGSAGPSRLVTVKMSEALREKIYHAAAGSGVTVSEFVRAQLSSASDRAIRRTRKRGRVKSSAADSIGRV